MHPKTKLIAAFIAAFGLSASGTFAATDSTQAGWSSWQGKEISISAVQVAKQGRGRDDVIEHPVCDDRGDDLACVLAAKGRGGRDDGVEHPNCDDHGDDLACVVASKGRGGHDDVVPEDLPHELEALAAKGSGRGTRTLGGSGCDGADDIEDVHPECA